MLCDLQIFSSGVYPRSATSCKIFLFPIVFGSNLIHIFGGKDVAAEHSMACSVLWSPVTPFERGRRESATFTKSAIFFWQWSVWTERRLRGEELKCNFWQRKVKTHRRFQRYCGDITAVFLSLSLSLSLSVCLGGNEKEGGGNDASLHSAMFDSARVRGVLRCYDAIDRVVRGFSLSLWCLLCEWRQKRPQKRQSFCSFVLFFLLLSNLLTVFVKRNVQN